MKSARSAEARATFIFRQAAIRPPSKEDLADLLALYRGHRAAYARNAAAAKKLIAVGERPADLTLNPVDLAAWTMVANLVLNLDEVVTKG